MQTSTEQLEQWFLRPLEQIREKTSGNSLFIELLISCVLYERYSHAKHDLSPSSEEFYKQLARDFTIDSDFPGEDPWRVDEDAAKAFWKIIRVGLAHHGMPLQKNRGEKDLPAWTLDDSYPDRTPIRFVGTGEEKELWVQSNVFVDRVIELWRKNPKLITKSKSFPFPETHEN